VEKWAYIQVISVASFSKGAEGEGGRVSVLWVREMRGGQAPLCVIISGVIGAGSTMVLAHPFS
jgi:hypothetical protein